MTQQSHDFVNTCGALLRESREALSRGDLVSASAKGWDAAVIAGNAYGATTGQNGGAEHFESLMLQLSKDPRGIAGSAEYAVSAMALADNVRLDWLDRSGIRRRLEDVQRLVNLVFDIKNPPNDNEALLRRAWACLANGSLAVASEKGWEAATHAAKTYAEAMGHDHIRSNYLSQVTRYLKQEPGGSEAGNWSMSAKMLLESFHAKVDWLDAELIGDDLNDVGKLVALVNATVKNRDKSSSR